MAAELEMPENPSDLARQVRKPKQKKRKKPSKSVKAPPVTGAKRKKPSEKLKKLFRKRAREYNSDDEDEEEGKFEEEEEVEEEEEREEGSEGDDEEEDGDDDRDEPQHAAVTKLVEGSRAFRLAFSTIMKIKLSKDPLGPILSAHKKLVAEKLAGEEEEHKVKKKTRKEKKLAAEKGHVKPPDNFLDSKEKYLISVATKGVVKLFNAVSKAQNPQKGMNPSSSKDAKVLAKRRKEAFLSELRKPTRQVNDTTSKANNDEPGWAPLRDSFMLTNSKLKDWDKMPDPAAEVGGEEIAMGSSSDDE